MGEWLPPGESDSDIEARLKLLAERLITTNGNEMDVLDLLGLSLYAVLAGEDGGVIAELLAELLRPAQV